MAIRPGISTSESSISRRPKAARDYQGQNISIDDLQQAGEAEDTYDVSDLVLLGGGSHVV